SRRFAEPRDEDPVVHASACIESGVSIGRNVSIGPFSVIAEGAAIGDQCRIGSHVTIGGGSRIGARASIDSGVRIGHDVHIGDDFVAHGNVVVGSDGFSFETAAEGAIEAAKQSFGEGTGKRQSNYSKIHSFGSVVIGDNVELGACTAIDRGTLEATQIGSGTKVDNLVHIAHNVVIGKDCLICGLVGIAGSARLGDRVVLAGMCGVKDHIRIGDDVVAGGATKIFSSVPSNSFVMGSPAVEMSRQIALYKSLRRLPRLLKRVARLERRLSGKPTAGREERES
ncbi:MAG: UDP-3-O-(3-hydroxymyristoyl)glucosamine N-acyltransferase, partial [Rhodobacteraceae bacterium]|nr:UDP-3-O-(3-hydroxymyristoyl)glucosamine N-acyltransferase [Paracoccaceae bacterium]